MTTNNYDEQIDAIQSKFNSNLDDFKKYYVYYNKNPEVNEFQTNYENSKSYITQLSNELFTLTKKIYDDIDYLESKMVLVSDKLKSEKKDINKMSSLLHNLSNTENGSAILIDDSKEEYNKQYYKNIELFAGICMIGFLLRSFSNKQ